VNYYIIERRIDTSGRYRLVRTCHTHILHAWRVKNLIIITNTMPPRYVALPRNVYCYIPRLEPRNEGKFECGAFKLVWAWFSHSQSALFGVLHLKNQLVFKIYCSFLYHISLFQPVFRNKTEKCDENHRVFVY
jgi:hypothetical protein